MRQRVVCPRLLAAHRNALARSGFGLVQQVALLPCKGRHAMQVGHVARMGQCGQRQTQHAGRITQIEPVVLPQLDRHQIARKLMRLLFMQRCSEGDITIHPGRDAGHKAAFTHGGTG